VAPLLAAARHRQAVFCARDGIGGISGALGAAVTEAGSNGKEHASAAGLASRTRRKKQGKANRVAELKQIAFFEIFSLHGGVDLTSLWPPSSRRPPLPSVAPDTQSPHHPHDRDLVPDVAAARCLDAAGSQRLRNFPVGPVPLASRIGRRSASRAAAAAPNLVVPDQTEKNGQGTGSGTRTDQIPT